MLDLPLDSAPQIARKGLAISVKALLRNKDEILVIREAKGDNSGKYHFPGGQMEPGETLAQALVREIKEETGITDIKIGSPYFVCEWPGRVNGERCEVVGIFFPCETNEREVVLSPEHDHALWIQPEDYSEHNMVELSQEIIERYVALDKLGGLF